nr:hypothetical protein [Tanacetum cinerariifolium]
MGDCDSQEVTRKKRRSVFDRLWSLSNGRARSRQFGDNTLSVYVSNFPLHLSVRELWNICGKKGNIVDVYIAKRKNKLGQMFVFCRYNGIDNIETLINLLNEMWIGRLRLHANIARFDRKEGPIRIQTNVKRHASYVSSPAVRGTANSQSYINVVRGQSNSIKDTDSMQLGESSSVLLSHEVNDGLSLTLIGCHKDFRSIANSKVICRNEGFLGVDTKYLGGLWVLFEFNDKDAKERFLKHEGILGFLCISGVRELCSWTSNFVLDDVDNEEEGSVGRHRNDEGNNLDEHENESVGDISVKENGEELQFREEGKKEVENNGERVNDSDPFELMSLIAKQGDYNKNMKGSLTPKYPSGFTQNDVGDMIHDFGDVCKPVTQEDKG